MNNATLESTEPAFRAVQANRGHMTEPHVVFAGGGSGGHLVPGVHLANEIRCRRGGGRFLFLRGRRRVESLVLEHAPGVTRELTGLRTPRGVTGRLEFAVRLPALLARSIEILRRFRADTVIGLGGYGAVPPVLAGRTLGLRVLLLEQNVRPGLATQLLGPFAESVCCAFDETVGEFSNGLLTGNPVPPRDGRLEPAAAFERFGFSPDRRTLLVVGGSQGAHGLNRLVVEQLGVLTPLGGTLQILHITGENDREWVERAYRRFRLSARVHAFVPDMQSAYRVADVVITRAGGTTLAELALAGLPAVLVPFPHHRDRHQYANARVFAAAGAGFVLEEGATDAAAFSGSAGALLRDPDLRQRMGRAASRLARPDAARRITDLLWPESPPAHDLHHQTGDRSPWPATQRESI